MTESPMTPSNLRWVQKIHIDVDAASVSKIIHADVPIVGSAKTVFLL